MDWKSYHHCTRCNIWIPYYTSNFHINECHKLICGGSHPLAKDGELILKINIIENELSRKLGASKPEKWTKCKEPEFVEKIKCKFQKNFAFINSSDLLCASIEAFSPVYLTAGNENAVFIAVPNDDLLVGTICLYAEGLDQYFPISAETSLIHICTIPNLRLAKQIEVNTLNPYCEKMAKILFKKKFNYNYEFGLPFVVKGKDKLIIKDLQNKPLEIEIVVTESLSNNGPKDMFWNNEGANSSNDSRSISLRNELNTSNTMKDSRNLIPHRDTETLGSFARRSKGIRHENKCVLSNFNSEKSQDDPNQVVRKTDASISHAHLDETKIRPYTPINRNVHYSQSPLLNYTQTLDNGTSFNKDKIDSSVKLDSSIFIASDVITKPTLPKESVQSRLDEECLSDNISQLNICDSKVNLVDSTLDSKVNLVDSTLDLHNESCDNALPLNSIATSTPIRENSSCHELTRSPQDISNIKKKRPRKRKQKNKENIVRKIEPPQFYLVMKETKVHVYGDKDLEVQNKERKKRYYKDQQYETLRMTLLNKLQNHGKNSLKSSWSAILLCGPPGTGKNLLVKDLCADLALPLFEISLLALAQTDSTNYYNDIYTNAKHSAPSVLLIDEIDSLCHERRSKYGKQKSSDAANSLLKLVQAAKRLVKPVIFVGVTNRPEAIPSHVRRAGHFDKDVWLRLPDEEKRAAMLWDALRDVRHHVTREQATLLATMALGFTGADLECAVRVAWQLAVQRWKQKSVHDELRLQFVDVQEGIHSVVPSFLRNDTSAVVKVHWSDIWGYDCIKQKLMKMVEESTCSKLRGVLLYGPPGCSKTMLVRALATETKFTFFPVKCSDLLSKFVGETEKTLVGVFERAKQSSPSLIFMDEIDSLCADRSGGFVVELLALLQDVLREGKVLVVGATNRPQALDEALLSPGCLEYLIHVDLPDCSSRCSIWKCLLEGVPQEDVCIHELCTKSAGFSCAEICGAYQTAAQYLLSCVHSGSLQLDDAKIRRPHLMRAIEESGARTPLSMLNSIKTFAKIK